MLELLREHEVAKRFRELKNHAAECLMPCLSGEKERTPCLISETDKHLGSSATSRVPLAIPTQSRI